MSLKIKEMENKNYKEKIVSISKNGKMKQVIRTRVIEGIKNRKGEKYKVSQTLHIKASRHDRE